MPKAYQGSPESNHYGILDIQPTAQKIADSVSVVNGTIVSGDVTSTRQIDGMNLQVQETGQFEITFLFSGIATVPARCKFVGRYQGNPAHNVFLEIYNYSTTTWVRVTTAAQDFPSSATEYVLFFNLPLDTDYVGGGSSDEVQLRIRHDSAAVGTHNMYINFIAMIEASLVLSSTPGTFAQIINLTEKVSNGIILDGVAGTMTIAKDGDYDLIIHVSGTGSGNVGFQCAVYINGVYEFELWRRRIGMAGDVGSASGGDGLSLSTGDVLSWWIAADMADTYATIFDAHIIVKEL